jgi:hypothetical protein
MTNPQGADICLLCHQSIAVCFSSSYYQGEPLSETSPCTNSRTNPNAVQLRNHRVGSAAAAQNDKVRAHCAQARVAVRIGFKQSICLCIHDCLLVYLSIWLTLLQAVYNKHLIGQPLLQTLHQTLAPLNTFDPENHSRTFENTSQPTWTLHQSKSHSPIGPPFLSKNSNSDQHSPVTGSRLPFLGCPAAGYQQAGGTGGRAGS